MATKEARQWGTVLSKWVSHRKLSAAAGAGLSADIVLVCLAEGVSVNMRRHAGLDKYLFVSPELSFGADVGQRAFVLPGRSASVSCSHLLSLFFESLIPVHLS